MKERQFIINETTALKIIQYLQKQPYKDVFMLINELQNMKIYDGEEQDADNIRS
jgi:hypothetical protein